MYKYISLLSDIQIYYSVKWNTNMKNKGHHHLLLVISIQHCHHQCPMFQWCLRLQCNAQVSCWIVPRRPSWFYEISCIAVIRGWQRWIYAGDLHYCSAQTPSSSSDTSRHLEAQLQNTINLDEHCIEISRMEQWGQFKGHLGTWVGSIKWNKFCELRFAPLMLK